MAMRDTVSMPESYQDLMKMLVDRETTLLVLPFPLPVVLVACEHSGSVAQAFGDVDACLGLRSAYAG